MLAYTYLGRERGGLTDKAEPVIMKDTDAIVRVTLASICTSDLHILHGSVPRAVPGITLGHEAVGIVQRVGAAVKKVRPVGAAMSTTAPCRTADGRWAAP